jgi:uncharacterized repeat protein (TIGR01451 family)
MMGETSMKRNYRLVGYLVVAAILTGLMMGQQAWATPSQTHGVQTIPTRTATPGPAVTSLPPTSPPPTSQPTATTRPTLTVQPTPGTPVPQPTLTSVTPTPAMASTAPSVAGALSLAVVVDRSQVWYGAAVTYTITVVNLSTDIVQNVVLIDDLPVGLEPGEIISGAAAIWQGRSLRAEKADLAPGEQYQLVFQAAVGDRAGAGTIIVNGASASAMGVSEATSSAAVAMPPAEMPQVGGS